jgi:hypothetical protein
LGLESGAWKAHKKSGHFRPPKRYSINQIPQYNPKRHILFKGLIASRERTLGLAVTAIAKLYYRRGKSIMTI